jgi:hypothetical protein
MVVHSGVQSAAVDVNFEQVSDTLIRYLVVIIQQTAERVKETAQYNAASSIDSTHKCYV